MNFIEHAGDTTVHFSDKFLMQVVNLKKWLNKYLIDIPIPLHTIFSYEDNVVDMNSQPKGFWKKIKPFKTSYFFSDHFIELMPQRKDFWVEIFGFIKKYETDKDYNNIQTVLVTGATGFLGMHVLRHLHAKGFKLVAFVRNSEKAKKFLSTFESIEIREGNLNDLNSIENACKGIDAIVHTAGLVGDWGSMKDFRYINVEGTKNLAIISHNAGIRHFVLIGSLGVYGDRDQDNIDENTQLEYTADRYSNSKIEQEFFVKKYFLQNKIPFTIIRPGFIYGEGDNNFMPRIVDNLMKKKLKFIGDGRNHINTVYVENVAVLVSEVIGNKDCFSRSYNITDKNQVTISEFVEDVSKGLGIKTPDKHIPLKVALTAAKCFEKIYRFMNIKKAPPFTCKKITFMARDRVINTDKSYAIIGDKSVSYKTGINKTIDHFIKNNS
jgi:nucleoside-diphosphate-sugar epimerase